jgi:hypothetical protein
MGPDTRTNCQSVDTSDEKIGNPNQRPRFTGALNTLAWVFTGFCTVAQRIKFRSSFDLGLLLRRRGSTALRSASTPLSATMLSRLSIKSGRQARWGFVRDGSWISPDACASVILIRIAHIYGGRAWVRYRCLRAFSPQGDVGSPRKSMRLLVGLHGESHISLMSNALQRVIRLTSKPLRRLRAQPFFEKLASESRVPKRSRERFHGRGSRASKYVEADPDLRPVKSATRNGEPHK